MKRLNLHQIVLPLSLAVLAFILTACSAGGEDSEPDTGVTTLIYAKLSDSGGVDRTAVSRFNRTHKDVQIEVKSYSVLSENGRRSICTGTACFSLKGESGVQCSAINGILLTR